MASKPETHEIEKTNVVLLSGFLGAGKTTLLKRILTWETDLADTVVLVNEFGDVGIDGAILKNSGSDVIELTSGCICCTLSADLMQSLISIREKFNPRQILIESSGVADPGSAAAVINEPKLAKYMTLSKIITVLDADFWEAREAFGPLFYNQLERANLILLNKIDQLEEGRISQFLNEIHNILPNCQVIPTIHCGIDPETLWAAAKPKTPGLMPIEFYQPDPTTRQVRPSVDASRYVTFTFESTQTIDKNCFHRFITELPWEVFRVKGPVQFTDRLDLLNFVGGKSEWLPWQGTPHTQLAFIGWDIAPDEILRKLTSCIKEK